MRRWRSVQASGIAGLSAAGAVAAHAGPAGLSDGRWLVVALAGAALAVGTIAFALGTALALDRRAARLHPGVPTPLAHAVDAPPLPALVAIMLVCQGCAHAALLAAGVPARTGAVASPLLHVALAVAGAVIVWSLRRRVARSSAGLVRAIAASLPRLLQRPGASGPAPAPARIRPRSGGVHGRAPPVATASAMAIASA
jgi:hypothetical protein